MLACVGLCVWLNTRKQSVRRCPLSPLHIASIPLCMHRSSLLFSRDWGSLFAGAVLHVQPRILASGAPAAAACSRGALALSREPSSVAGTQRPAPRKKRKKNRAAPSADEIRMAELCPGPVDESPTIRYFLPGLRVPRPTEVDTPYPGSRSRRSCRAEKRIRLGARAPLPFRVSTAAEGSASHVVLSEHRGMGRSRDERSEREKLRPCPKRRQHPLPRSRRPRKKALL